MSGNRKEQWDRVRSGGPLHPKSANQEEITAGGLVVKALWEQLKEQQERQDMLMVETSLITENGLDTDEILFLGEEEAKKEALRREQQREMKDFQRRVAQLTHTEETSYVEHLFQAKQKQRAEKAQKKKKRTLIPVITTNTKEDERPSKKLKVEEEQPEKNESEEDEIILAEGLGGLVSY